ncbi:MULTISPECIES: hypothetical protein [unclassified Streptomyces]|uniref:hypothetical protein n=1 Tax=unclassified Streptomyces TaxID=2593676 RepID=UPI002E15FA5F|nr:MULTISPECIES: hypothetical protein [unclassified Streptomyces]WSR23760.1 hypothetical protein OG573_34950 [Streptomyces sp. NBC_01205]
MDALVADLVLPGYASMYVMSTMETSRELIRHSYYRYEFATVVVTHSLLLRPPSEADVAAVDMSGAQPEDRLARLWEEHRRALYPDSFRGIDVEGVELILLDADVAGLVQRELNGGLDDSGIAILWACIADLDKVVTLINSQYCASYFARLRTMAKLVAARYIPTAT